MMNQEEIFNLSFANQERAKKVLVSSKVANVWEKNGCRVNIVGSLRMGLLASHKDIDLHVYSKDITEESSFAVAAQIAKLPNVIEIKCINGLHTDEHCIAWHIFYKYEEDIWQIDVIHIEEGTKYDGFFERMADRITEVMTDEQKERILKLKFDTPSDKDYHGVEYYEAVIADGISNMEDLEVWVDEHRKKPMYYWIP
ncbi:MAG: phosphoglycerate mutase family protein [Muribaculaceae bacterium]|nr:phosphoglycerate mutase family protein [Muribaculaceae bacterium]